MKNHRNRGTAHTGLQGWALLGLALSVFIANSLMASSAQADIYMQEDSSEEILLTNLPGTADRSMTARNKRFILLVEEEKPARVVGTGSKTSKKKRADLNNAANFNIVAGAHPYATLVERAAQQTLLDPALIYAVMATESANNPQAVSSSGARGLMQLMPATARRFNVADPHDPQQNINAGAHYLQELQAMFKGNTSLMLAAYNAGPNAVIKHGYRIPPYAETMQYVPRVLNLYNAQGRLPATD